MNEKKIIRCYVKDKMTLRHVSELFNTDHHRIKRILLKNKIQITKRKTRKKFTDEHKRKISEAKKRLINSGWVSPTIGKKMPKMSLYKNMRSHLRYNVELEWLCKFEDIEKLKFLNRSISRKRDVGGWTTEMYKSYIEKFYIDSRFNSLYLKWLETNDKWMRPSLDHVHPKSKGCNLSTLENLRFISWLENRAKADMDIAQWEDIKKRINEYF